MKNYYALQYQILIFSLVAFNLAYSFFEFPYLVNMYSIKDGFNTLENIRTGFFELNSFIISNNFNLKAVYLTKVIFAFGLLCKPLRKISLLGLVIHAYVFENIGIQNTPEIEFLNILYLFLIAVPEKKFQLFKSYKKTLWMYPTKQQHLLWIVAALAYSGSGYYKLMTPAWQNGQFIKYLLTQHLSRFDFSYLITNPGVQTLCVALTYLAMTTELMALPMVFHRYTRLFSFILLTGMHIFILILADVSQITLGMLAFHIYLFEPKWLRELSRFKIFCTGKSEGLTK